jgi:DNA-binding response OmpR family regulator
VASFIRRGLAADKFVVDLAQEGQPELDLALSKDYSLIIVARSQSVRHRNNVIVGGSES